VAVALCRAIAPKAPPSIRAAIEQAARVLDVGRTFDVVNRHEHVAEILLSTELNGFTHAELALLSSIVGRAGDRHSEILTLALGADIGPKLVERAAIILSLADEIEARCPHGQAIAIHAKIGQAVTLSIPALRSWLAKDLESRFERAFNRSLIVRRRTGAPSRDCHAGGQSGYRGTPTTLPIVVAPSKSGVPATSGPVMSGKCRSHHAFAAS
jgi:exopolyphosphatase/pppGpp-phosphohydrolase